MTEDNTTTEAATEDSAAPDNPYETIRKLRKEYGITAKQFVAAFQEEHAEALPEAVLTYAENRGGLPTIDQLRPVIRTAVTLKAEAAQKSLANL